jgi:serine protease Do
MNKVIQRVSFVALAAAYLTLPLTVLAQKDLEEKVVEGKQKKETEQIIITRKAGNNDKVVIELNGDKVTVNGKAIDDKNDDDISVSRHKVKDGWAFNGLDGFGSWGDHFSLATTDENRAMLGVTTEKAEKGLEIKSISKDGGAEKAGLKKGDVITKIDDTKIEESDDLSKTVRAHKPGDKVSVTYLRDGKEQKVTAELGKYKGVTTVRGYASPGARAYQYKTPGTDFEIPRVQSLPRKRSTTGQGGIDAFSWNWSGGSPKLGMSVQDTEDGKGVKVLEVDEEGNASKAGIKEEDIITEVDGKAVNSTDEIAKIIRESKEKVSVKMKLQRKGKTETLEVKIPRKIKTTDL